MLVVANTFSPPAGGSACGIATDYAQPRELAPGELRRVQQKGCSARLSKAHVQQAKQSPTSANTGSFNLSLALLAYLYI